MRIPIQTISLLISICFCLAVYPMDSDYRIRNLKTNTAPVDYLVITVDSFVQPIFPLLSHRATNNMYDDVSSPGVVTMNDINETFPDQIWPHQRIHEFLRYAYSKWPCKIKYLLLLGNGQIGPDKHQPNALVPYFPARINLNKYYDYTLQDTIWSCRYGKDKSLETLANAVFSASDFYYAFTAFVKDTNYTDNFDYLKPNIFISRIPACNKKEVVNVVTKTIEWDTTITGAFKKNCQLLITDDHFQLSGPDRLNFTASMENIISTAKLEQNYILDKFYGNEYQCTPITRRFEEINLEKLDSMMNESHGVVQMVGRSNYNQFTDEASYSIPKDTARIRQIKSTFFLDYIGYETLEQTYNISYALYGGKGLLPSLLLSSDKGAVGAIGAYCPTDYTSNMRTKSNFYNMLYSPDKSIKELLDSACVMTGMNNLTTIGFQGDPALRLYNTAGKIDTFSIDRINSDFDIEINCSVTKTISGPFEAAILGYAQGNVVTDSAPEQTILPQVTKYHQTPEKIFTKTITGNYFSSTSPLVFALNPEDTVGVRKLSVYIRGQGWDIFRVFEVSTFNVSSIEKKNIAMLDINRVSSHPNPFFPQTTITFPNPDNSAVITIFNIKGQKVFENLNFKESSLTWKPANLPCGTFIVKVLAKGKVYNQRILYLK